MAETLMGFIKTLKAPKIKADKGKVSERCVTLKEAGFETARKLLLVKQFKYKRITDDAIRSFLATKASELSGHEEECTNLMSSGAVKKMLFVDFLVTGDGIHQFEQRLEWVETRIEIYNGCPPERAVASLMRAKKRDAFDYFTVAKVEHKTIRDPLLLGRIDGVEDRFFIAQWGTDVQLDDLI